MRGEQAEPCSEWPQRSLLKVEQHPHSHFCSSRGAGSAQDILKSCGYQKKGNAKMLWFTDDVIRSRKLQGVGNDEKQIRAQ